MQFLTFPASHLLWWLCINCSQNLYLGVLICKWRRVKPSEYYCRDWMRTYGEMNNILPSEVLALLIFCATVVAEREWGHMLIHSGRDFSSLLWNLNVFATENKYLSRTVVVPRKPSFPRMLFGGNYVIEVLFPDGRSKPLLWHLYWVWGNPVSEWTDSELPMASVDPTTQPFLQ